MKFRFRHNKSYIDQASSVRVVEVWPRSNAKKKKKTGENPAILTSLLVNNVFIIYSKYCRSQQYSPLGKMGGGGGTNCRKE